MVCRHVYLHHDVLPGPVGVGDGPRGEDPVRGLVLAGLGVPGVPADAALPTVDIVLVLRKKKAEKKDMPSNYYFFHC